MAESGDLCATSDKNGWTVWSVHGRFDRMTAQGIGEQADRMFKAAQKFAIDMGDLEYLSSAGIRVLLKLTKQAKTEGKEFALASPTGMVKDVLSESRIDMFVAIYTSTDELP